MRIYTLIARLIDTDTSWCVLSDSYRARPGVTTNCPRCSGVRVSFTPQNADGQLYGQCPECRWSYGHFVGSHPTDNAMALDYVWLCRELVAVSGARGDLLADGFRQLEGDPDIALKPHSSPFSLSTELWRRYVTVLRRMEAVAIAASALAASTTAARTSSIGTKVVALLELRLIQFYLCRGTTPIGQLAPVPRTRRTQAVKYALFSDFPLGASIRAPTSVRPATVPAPSRPAAAPATSTSTARVLPDNAGPRRRIIRL